MDRKLKKRVNDGRVTKWEPGKAALAVHTASTAEKIAARAKDERALQAAVTAKLEAQRDFAECCKAEFPHGGPRNGIKAPDLASWCEQYGFATRTVQRWYKLLDEPTFEAELSGRLERAWRLLSMETTAHIGNNSGVQEWYTPPEIIEAAREVLGGIDLDPASSAAAQEIVKAEQFFTAEDDGLKQQWKGRVWMNPPYAQPLIGYFCDMLMADVDDGSVTAAVTLTNNATDTAWAQALLSMADAVCFLSGRVRFWAPGKPAAAPLQGQMLCYFGSDTAKFAEAFFSQGVVLWPMAGRGARVSVIPTGAGSGSETPA